MLLRQMNIKNILVVFSFFLIVQLDAHNRSESYSKFHFLNVEDGVEVKVTGTINDFLESRNRKNFLN